MSTRKINVLGYVGNDTKLVVEAQDFKMKISNNSTDGTAEAPNPLECLLAGFAGSVNEIGRIVAKEMDLELKSLQVEISGILVDIEGKTKNEKTGYKSIEIVVKPNSDAPLSLLKEWIDIVKTRYPERDSLLNETPVTTTLIKEYT